MNSFKGPRMTKIVVYLRPYLIQMVKKMVADAPPGDRLR